MKTAQAIINETRFALTELIVTYMRKLDAYFTTGEKDLMTDADEHVVIDFAECVDTPYVRVEVDNSYLDVEDRCYENKPVIFIATGDDYNFYVGVGNNGEDEEDIDWDELSVEELVSIAKILEKTYNRE